MDTPPLALLLLNEGEWGADYWKAEVRAASVVALVRGGDLESWYAIPFD